MAVPRAGHDERVVVIEHDAFRHLWDAELDGGLIIEREDADKIEPGAVTIFPDEGRRRYDIAIPQLTRALGRSEHALGRLDPADIAGPQKPLEVPDVTPDEYISYRGMHLIDKGVIEEYEFEVPYAEDPSGVITWYTKGVAKAGGVERISGAFATLAPMVRDYLAERVFEHSVDLSDKVVLRRLAENDAEGSPRAALVSRRKRALGPRLGLREGPPEGLRRLHQRRRRRPAPLRRGRERLDRTLNGGGGPGGENEPSGP